ncbi:hypothetical protein WOLCODRAFT_153283 [Wolfiporia cocos MD-104 SS10]|uniref:Uncharacterized protein n=1 Tax=Wolfiporia cocos (strain MD-104) TaxID=742152 RepID=A0A2H3JP03_WOLCO|nr:hypothetical protein WOLCODRAFT_153283 [Wolfiporia cocos MD-104 SS10]
MVRTRDPGFPSRLRDSASFTLSPLRSHTKPRTHATHASVMCRKPLPPVARFTHGRRPGPPCHPQPAPESPQRASGISIISSRGARIAPAGSDSMPVAMCQAAALDLTPAHPTSQFNCVFWCQSSPARASVMLPDEFDAASDPIANREAVVARCAFVALPYSMRPSVG